MNVTKITDPKIYKYLKQGITSIDRETVQHEVRFNRVESGGAAVLLYWKVVIWIYISIIVRIAILFCLDCSDCSFLCI